MDPKQAVHVSAWCYPMQSAALLRIRTQPYAAVEQGSELFKQEQELKVPLTQGACHMETGRKKTRTSHKEEVEMTKPNQELLRCCFPTWEGQMSSAPLGCGLLAARVSHLRLSSQHFPPCTLSAGVSIFTNLLHRGLHLLIFCCSCLDWGVGDAAVLGSAAKHDASEHSPCSASHGSWRSHRRPGSGCDGWQNLLHGSSLGVFALQMCTETRQARGLPGIRAHKRCLTMRSHSGWCGGFPLLVQ